MLTPLFLVAGTFFLLDTLPRWRLAIHAMTRKPSYRPSRLRY